MTAVSGQTSSLADSRPLYAIGLRLLAMLMISIMFAAVKWLSEQGVNIVETMFYRQLFALPVAFVSLMLGPGLAGLRTNRIGAHLRRSCVGTTGMILNFGAVILLPLTEAMTIGFTVPIFATILATIFLGERPGMHRWLAVLAGFVGVIVIIGPGHHAGMPALGIAVAISAAIVTASVSLLVRQLGATEAPTTTVFYFAAVPLPPLAIAMLYFGQAHDATTWLIIAIMGLSGGLAQLLMTSALRWAPVSLVLPMDYSTLLWSTTLGWLLWNSLPGPTTWIGAIIIAMSGVIIVWRERVRHRDNVNRGVSVT